METGRKCHKRILVTRRAPSLVKHCDTNNIPPLRGPRGKPSMTFTPLLALLIVIKIRGFDLSQLFFQIILINITHQGVKTRRVRNITITTIEKSTQPKKPVNGPSKPTYPSALHEQQSEQQKSKRACKQGSHSSAVALLTIIVAALFIAPLYLRSLSKGSSTRQVMLLSNCSLTRSRKSDLSATQRGTPSLLPHPSTPYQE